MDNKYKIIFIIVRCFDIIQNLFLDDIPFFFYFNLREPVSKSNRNDVVQTLDIESPPL